MQALGKPAPRLGRSLRIRILLLILILLALGTLSFGAEPDAAQRERLAEIRVPFVENCGQWDERVAFAAKTGFGAAFVTRDGQLVYSLTGETEGWSVTETLVSGKPVPQPLQPAVTRVSYFHGNDRSRWQSGLSSYVEVGLGEVWAGISVALRARGGNVEKLFVVDPGADVGEMQLRVDGTSSLRVDGDGSLIAETGAGTVRLSRPEAFQEREGARHQVPVAYIVRGSLYGFRLGDYDPSLAVTIDPLLQSSFLGGTGTDRASAIAVDAIGDVLVAGSSSSPDFPGTAGGVQAFLNGISDGFVARLDPSLTSLIQTTYLGGSGWDGVTAMTLLESTGDVFVAGITASADFPGTTGGSQQAFGGIGDGFVARLNSELSILVQATYLGGSLEDGISAVAIAAGEEELFVAGWTDSLDLAGTAGGAQPGNGGQRDGLVARLDLGLTMLLQSTYLGGSGEDRIQPLAIDSTTTDVVVAGVTSSVDFPGTVGGAQPAYGGGTFDGFVTRLNSSLTTLIQATYLGGGGLYYYSDAIGAMKIRPSTRDVFVAGWTTSSDFPRTAGGLQSSLKGSDGYGFIAFFNAALTNLVQATYLGGSAYDSIGVVEFDPTAEGVLVAGQTSSPDFPGTAGGAQLAFGGYFDGFLARLDPALTALRQATYLGGSGQGFEAADLVAALLIHPETGEVIATGQTDSADFPETAGGAQQTFFGGPPFGQCDAFVARLTPDLAALLSPVGVTIDPLPNPGSYDGDFVLEPGETPPVIPYWQNLSNSPLTPTGQASAFTGPPGATYTIASDTVAYPTIPPGGVSATASAYFMSVSVPATRPATHWDAQFTETLDVPLVLPYRRTLHIGDSFPDVPRSSIFYRFIENVLHHGVTAGCGGGNYCPEAAVTRAQMAALLLRAEHGPLWIPPEATGLVFFDVSQGSFAADWIEQLFHEGITGGCGGGNYCPDNPVTRAQMAAFLLKAEHGSTYVPLACNGMFADVMCPSLFADWIEQLAAEGITGGCGGTNYCPNRPTTRGQMATFLVKTFGLQLYGP